MSSDHIWPILFFVSLAGNLILLFYRPLLRLLRRGEEVSEDEIMAMVEEGEESGRHRAQREGTDRERLRVQQHHSGGCDDPPHRYGDPLPG